jgi:hypothetical protein
MTFSFQKKPPVKATVIKSFLYYPYFKFAEFLLFIVIIKSHKLISGLHKASSPAARVVMMEFETADIAVTKSSTSTLKECIIWPPPQGLGPAILRPPGSALLPTHRQQPSTPLTISIFIVSIESFLFQNKVIIAAKAHPHPKQAPAITKNLNDC